MPGNQAVVPIYLTNNPGIASLRISIAYDSEAMTIENAEDCKLLKGTGFNTDDLMQAPFYLYWENDNATENDTASGQIAAAVLSALRQRRFLREADRFHVFFSDSSETKPRRLMVPQEDLFFR